MALKAKPRARKERTENAAKRRRQIIEAATRSIIRHGLAGTTLATVSAEAGLSQGVAVFYFQNKQKLLADVLRNQYQLYQSHWQRALAEAGEDPVLRVAALVRADFDAEVCNPNSLIVWHAFWGEATARPLYAEIAQGFDATRARAMRDACAALLEACGRSGEAAGEIGTTIDSLTDGFWLRIYLSTAEIEAGQAARLTGRYLGACFPEHAERLESIVSRGASQA